MKSVIWMKYKDIYEELADIEYNHKIDRAIEELPSGQYPVCPDCGGKCHKELLAAVVLHCRQCGKYFKWYDMQILEERWGI